MTELSTGELILEDIVAFISVWVFALLVILLVVLPIHPML